MFQHINFLDVIFQLIAFGLIFLLILSFVTFIRRGLLNSSEKNNQLHELNKKLDKVIKLLEQDKK